MPIQSTNLVEGMPWLLQRQELRLHHHDSCLIFIVFVGYGMPKLIAQSAAVYLSEIVCLKIASTCAEPSKDRGCFKFINYEIKI